MSPALQHRDSRPRGRTTDTVRSVAREVDRRPAPCCQRVSGQHVLVRHRAVVPTSRSPHRPNSAVKATAPTKATSNPANVRCVRRRIPLVWTVMSLVPAHVEHIDAVQRRAGVRRSHPLRPTFAASQPAPAQRALDDVSALVRRVNGLWESELHDVSLPVPSVDAGRRPSRHLSLRPQKTTSNK
jgi:hypothetical protein